MNAAVEQAAQLPARAGEAMQHLGDRLGMHGGGLLPAFADGVPGGELRFDVETPQYGASESVRPGAGDPSLTTIHGDVVPDSPIGTAPHPGHTEGPAGGSPGRNADEPAGDAAVPVNVITDASGRSATLPDNLVGRDGEVVLLRDGMREAALPTEVYVEQRITSHHNPGAGELLLGKFDPERISGYIEAASARRSSYFDMGENRDSIRAKYDLNDEDLFEYFNVSVLEDAIPLGKQIFFSHDP